MTETPRQSERLFRPRPDVTPVRVVAALVVFGTFSVAGGLLGIIGGAFVGGASLLLAAPVTIALGHVFLLGVLPDPTLVQIAVVELGFALVLAVAAMDLTASRRTVSATLFCFGGLVLALRVAIGAVDDLWVICGLFAGLLAAVAYGLYRYELVQRGLIQEGEA